MNVRRLAQAVMGYYVPTAEEYEQAIAQEQDMIEQREQYDTELEQAEAGEPAISDYEKQVNAAQLASITYWVDKQHQLRLFVKWAPGEMNEATASRIGNVVSDLTNGKLNEMTFNTLLEVGQSVPEFQTFIKNIVTSWQEADNLGAEDPVIPSQMTLRKFAHDTEGMDQ